MIQYCLYSLYSAIRSLGLFTTHCELVSLKTICRRKPKWNTPLAYAPIFITNELCEWDGNKKN